jgi:hypothetical protein
MRPSTAHGGSSYDQILVSPRGASDIFECEEYEVEVVRVCIPSSRWSGFRLSLSRRHRRRCWTARGTWRLPVCRLLERACSASCQVRARTNVVEEFEETVEGISGRGKLVEVVGEGRIRGCVNAVVCRRAWELLARWVNCPSGLAG